ncbi:3-phosphoserine phosphatase [Actinidia rufa]|uniref:phosphoserine phosphatase n=1 Tax=Actinidia rufa TaxID=165716 RepID=A0A7J0H1L9_9ERIC|nr:3-phosphoserine phosphatase [Actinidia rufa]
MADKLMEVLITARINPVRASCMRHQSPSVPPYTPHLVQWKAQLLVPAKEVLQLWQNADAVCFDVDSTVCLDEGIDELAEFCGAGKAVAEWTAGFNFIAFQLISPGIDELVKKLKAKNTAIYLVSGGFRQMINALKPGGADLFTCYAGVQLRDAVAAKADWLVFRLNDLINSLE